MNILQVILDFIFFVLRLAGGLLLLYIGLSLLLYVYMTHKYKTPKECPKCNNKPLHIEYDYGKHEFYCPSCQIGTKQYWSHLTAIRDWNHDKVYSDTHEQD